MLTPFESGKIASYLSYRIKVKTETREVSRKEERV